MRKLQNTIYITNEEAYLTLDGENLVIKVDGKTAGRFPFDNIENIICFNYLGCSPALMGKCVELNIPINFITPYGKFLAKVCGGTKGNVFLRVQQIDIFKSHSLTLAKNTILAKTHNNIKTIKRSQHDYEELRTDTDINKVLNNLLDGITSINNVNNEIELLGIEGNLASQYFSIFNKLIRNDVFKFTYRNKRPPLDEVNALLSFVYTLMTCDCASALETVGLDSYIGYYHKLRSGRESLACDLVEEMRCIAERFVLTQVNLKTIKPSDFDKLETGTVYLSKEGKAKLLNAWQEKKRTEFKHAIIKEKIPLGLLPYVQANLLAKYIRGDIKEYPNFLYQP